MATTHIMTSWDEKTIGVRNHLGTTRCGIDVFANLDEAPRGPKLARSQTTMKRDQSDCKRCRDVYDRSSMK